MSNEPLAAMTTEEYDRYVKHRQEQEHKEQLRRDLERVRRKMHNTRQELRHATDAARKAGIL